jgi:hypothetical protein
VFLASTVYIGQYGHILHSERSFFGVTRVTDDAEKQLRMLLHGATIHGLQSLDLARAKEPLSYYSKAGPVGQAFDAFSGSADENQVAIVGLGAGTMACYISPPQQLTYYEIDPLVERIAENPRYFTFLRDCGPQARIVLGDARLSLQSAPDHGYGIIIVDAFSGDSIPVHLVTREALQLYLTKLTPNGILVFHITNTYLDLQPVLAALAADAGLVGLIETDAPISDADIKQGSLPSVWVIIGRSANDLGKLVDDSRWKPLLSAPGSKVWTDDFSSVISVFKWK